jgi:hypothetical protein
MNVAAKKLQIMHKQGQAARENKGNQETCATHRTTSDEENDPLSINAEDAAVT